MAFKLLSSPSNKYNLRYASLIFHMFIHTSEIETTLNEVDAASWRCVDFDTSLFRRCPKRRSVQRRRCILKFCRLDKFFVDWTKFRYAPAYLHMDSCALATGKRFLQTWQCSFSFGQASEQRESTEYVRILEVILVYRSSFVWNFGNFQL